MSEERIERRGAPRYAVVMDARSYGFARTQHAKAALLGH